MRFNRLLAAMILASVPQVAFADCLGFFNETEPGYRLRAERLEKIGETVARGTTLKFKGIARVRDRFFLTRSRSDVIYDAQNIELTGGCDLPTVDLGRVR